MNCLECKFYELGKPNAVIHREGVCHRYPTPVHKMKMGWCGEYVGKVVKNSPKKTKKPTKRRKKVTKKKA